MNHSATILLIDDDIELCASMTKFLATHGFKTIAIHESKDIEAILKDNKVDLILLDIILPGGKNGIALCKLIRQLTSSPIIMLTGVEEDVEKIVSLEIGADHYITKPFSTRVLLAYINACLRREKKNTTHLVGANYKIYEFLDWKLNETARILLSPRNHSVKLTSAEFILLHALLQRPQCVISRDKLLDLINSDSDSFDRSIDILISRLRSKIESNPKNPEIILTQRNLGYSLACSVNETTMNSQDWHKLNSNTGVSV